MAAQKGNEDIKQFECSIFNGLYVTDDIEKKAEDYFSEIDDIGGVIPAIEQGFFQREIAKSAADYQRKIDEGKRIVVGVNEFIKENEEIDIPILEIGSEAGDDQLKKLLELRKNKIEKLINIISIGKNNQR